MAVRNKLSSVDRVIALSLGVVWLGTGAAGLVLGLIHGQFILVPLAFFAIWYGGLWFRVAARSRKLASWREFIMPWRAQQAVKHVGACPGVQHGPVTGAAGPVDLFRSVRKKQAMKTQVEFRSDKFPPYDGEEEGINPGLWGKRLAECLQKYLPLHGLKVTCIGSEDWGWMVENDCTRIEALCRFAGLPGKE